MAVKDMILAFADLFLDLLKLFGVDEETIASIEETIDGFASVE